MTHVSGERVRAAAAEAAGPRWMQLWAGNEAPAQQGEESLSPLYFFNFFLFPTDLNHKFEQPKTVFRIWGKNKSCLEI